MASHKLQLSYDDDTGEVVLTHRVSIDVAGQVISHEEPLELGDEDRANLIAWLKALLDGAQEESKNTVRDEMAGRATLLAIQHAAAVANTLPANTKALKVASTLGTIGGAKHTKVG